MVKLTKKNLSVVFVLISSAIIIIDQLIKFLVVKFNPKLDLGILDIIFIKNSGAGFGILQGQIYILGTISLIVAVVIIYYYNKIPKEIIPQVLTALFLGGVIGNLIDRFFRGYVVDFINFRFWPAFNLSDACISIATLGLIIYLWKKK